MKSAISFAAVFAIAAVTAVHAAAVHGRGAVNESSISYVPVPAPAASPAAASAPSIQALHIVFEIMSINYFDLTRKTCPQKVVKKIPKVAKAVATPGKKSMMPVDPLGHALDHIDRSAEDFEKHGKTLKKMKMPKVVPPRAEPDVDKGIFEVHGHAKQIEKNLKDAHEDHKKMLKGPKMPWMKKKEPQAALLQAESCMLMKRDLVEAKTMECTTVGDVLREAIKETVRDVLECLFNKIGHAAPGPAPMPAAPPLGMLPGGPSPAGGVVPLPPMPPGAAFMQRRGSVGPSPGPAPAPAPGPSMMPQVPDPKIFVTLSPGRELGKGRTVKVEVAFLERPGNGFSADVALATHLIEHAVEHNIFHKEIQHACQKVTGIKNLKITKPVMTHKKIKQFDIGKCESHIKSIVNQFVLHYTRDQVPMALYNECTNFITKMSFSHDYVLDPDDTARCRQATVKLERKWDYGQSAEDKDFEEICVHACEAKYGKDAPTCNIAHGDGIAR